MRAKITSDEGAMRVPLDFCLHPNCKNFGCIGKFSTIVLLLMADVPRAEHPDTMDTLVEADTVPGEPAAMQDWLGDGNKYFFFVKPVYIFKVDYGNIWE